MVYRVWWERQSPSKKALDFGSVYTGLEPHVAMAAWEESRLADYGTGDGQSYRRSYMDSVEMDRDEYYNKVSRERQREYRSILNVDGRINKFKPHGSEQ